MANWDSQPGLIGKPGTVALTAAHTLTLQSVSADTQALMQEVGGVQIPLHIVLERFANLVSQMLGTPIGADALMDAQALALQFTKAEMHALPQKLDGKDKRPIK